MKKRELLKNFGLGAFIAFLTNKPVKKDNSNFSNPSENLSKINLNPLAIKRKRKV